MTTIESPRRHLRRKSIAIGLGIIYYLTFLTCFYELITPYFAYNGLRLFVIPDWAWIISFVLSLFPLLWMPLEFARPSDFASWFIYLFLIFPSNIIVFMVSSAPPGESIILPLALNAAFYLFEFVRRRGRLLRIATFRNSEMLFKVVLPVITIILSLVSLSYVNFEVLTSLTDVYDRRLEARDILTPQSLEGYLNAFLAGVCIPIGIIYGLQERKWHLIAVVVLAAVAMFSLSGAKGAFLSPLFFGGIYILASRGRKHLGFSMLLLFILLTGLPLLENLLAGTNVLALYVVRRKMVVPSELTTYYWEFFSQNPFVMMKDSVIGWLIPADANYLDARARIIGFEFFGRIESNANANIWATAYADFGYLGMAVTSVLAAFTLRLVDSLGVESKFVVASVVSAYIGFVWTEGAFYTAFMSNGVLMLVVIVWLYPFQSGGTGGVANQARDSHR